MRHLVKAVSLLSVMLMLSYVPGVCAYYASGRRLMCYALSTPVTVDGKWTTPEEWIDAAEASVEGAYFRVKHDNDYAYFLIEHVADVKVDAGIEALRDAGFVCIDTKNDGGSKPMTDDNYFSILWTNEVPPRQRFYVAYGTDSDWSPGAETTSAFSGASSSDQSKNPRSTSTHVTYELQIPKQSFVNATAVGLMLRVKDKDVYRSWPPGGKFDTPRTWADLVFSTKQIQNPPKSGAIVSSLIIVADLTRLEGTPSNEYV